MAESISFAGLGEWQRAEVHRHLATTYHLNYAVLERMDALVFGLAFDDPAVVRTEPPAVLLRELRDAAAAGGSVRLPRLGKGDAARFSELLRVCHYRAGREARDGQVTEFLGQLWRQFDAAHKVPQDEYERAERILYA